MKGVLPVVLLQLHRARPQVEAPLGDAIGEAAHQAAEERVLALMEGILFKSRSTAAVKAETEQAAAAQAATAAAAAITTATALAAQVCSSMQQQRHQHHH